MNFRSSLPPRMTGFSLLDLLIATVILGILVAIAVPSFSSSIQKSRRSDGMQALRTLQLAQERYRANNTTYGTLAQIGVNAASPGNWYTLAVTNPTATSYTATATAVAGTSQVSDKSRGTSCATLTVNQDTGATPTVCWNP